MESLIFPEAHLFHSLFTSTLTHHQQSVFIQIVRLMPRQRGLYGSDLNNICGRGHVCGAICTRFCDLTQPFLTTMM
ncbi:hypothetical protein DMI60_23335 [Escherichia coli]|nr:hypothetical protein [Escherichia coli]